MKKLVIVVIAAVLVVGGTIGAVIGVLNSPKQVAARALDGVLEDLADREELAPLMNVFSRGSVEFSLDGDGFIGSQSNLAAKGKIYFSEKAVMLDDLTLMSGNLMLEGDLYLSEDLIYVENRDILKGAWGLEKGKLSDEWEDSIFAPTAAGDFSLDQTTFDMVGELLEALDEDMDEKMVEDVEKLLNRYTKKTWKLIGKYAEFDSENKDVRINKERKSARIITITLTADGVAAILEDLYDYLAKDDDLANLVAKYGDRFPTLLKELYQIDDAAETYDEFLVDLEEKMDAYVDSIEEYMDSDLVVTVVTPTSSAELLMLNVEYDKTDLVKIQFGHEGARKTNCITVELGETTSYIYRVNKNDKKAFEAELLVNDDPWVTLKVDREEETYELLMADFWLLEGTVKSKGGKHTVTVDSMESMIIGVIIRYDRVGVSLTLNEKDKMPAPAKEVSSFLKMDRETYDGWAEMMDRLGLSDLADGLNRGY